jgi:hypothetical protein
MTQIIRRETDPPRFPISFLVFFTQGHLDSLFLYKTFCIRGDGVGSLPSTFDGWS